MLPKGTLILLASGFVLLAATVGGGALFVWQFGPVPLWLRLPLLLVVAIGVLLFVMGGYSVVVGIADAVRKHSRK